MNTSETSEDFDRQVTALETALQLPLPEITHQQIRRDLESLRYKIAQRKLEGKVDVSGELYGVAVGVNVGTVQVFFGDKFSDDGKRLLNNYLDALILEYGRLRLGKLLAKEQTGREESTAPTLPLRSVYTSLATKHRVAAKKFRRAAEGTLDEMNRGNPQRVLPEHVRLATLRPTPILSNGRIDTQWLSMYREIQATSEQRISGTWYRPELAVEAIATQPRLVLLGSPGSGKSTVLRYLVVSIAEALISSKSEALDLVAWSEISTLPVPLFCQLGKVATKLSNDPDQDLEMLVASLLAPVESAGLRSDLRKSMLGVWRDGGALLCLDGLDEVNGMPEPTVQGPRSRRQRMADAIRSLAAQIGHSRIVVTCRTKPYEQDAAWQLRDNWVTRQLEPFTFGQVRHFVPAWYVQTATTPNAKYVSSEARARADKLVEVLERRSGLQDLTTSPLLLTMLVLLHYNKKQLPEERADIYEEMVELLLDRWEGVRSTDVDRREEPIGERLGLPQLTTSDLRPVIHEIGFEAHKHAVDGRGVLTGNMMREKLDTFFAYKISPNNPRLAPRGRCADASDTFIRLLREETGLIQEEDDDTYVLPHLTFEEYLAACHLAGQENIDLAYDQWCDGTERWREVMLLLMGRLRRHEKFALAFSWLMLLIAQRKGKTEKSLVQRQRDALLAGACYEAMGQGEELARRGHDIVALELGLRQSLAELLSSPVQELLLPQRVEAGRILSRLSDSRYPRTLDEWRHELLSRTTHFGFLNNYFCYIPTGSYHIGDWDGKKEDKQGNVSLQGYWIAQFPITVDQFASFANANSQPNSGHWWTHEGLIWKQRAQRIQPLDMQDNNPEFANEPVVGVTWYEAVAYCNWLAEMLSDALPDEYTIRLPTEAEWEVAASFDSNGQRRLYPWGSLEPTQERAIYVESGLGRPSPVGCCPRGRAACGALDLAGNVWEWTASHYARYPEQCNIPVADFPQFERFTLEEMVVPVRGGSWNNDSAFMRCGARVRHVPDNLDDGIQGFRIAVTSCQK